MGARVYVHNTKDVPCQPKTRDQVTHEKISTSLLRNSLKKEKRVYEVCLLIHQAPAQSQTKLSVIAREVTLVF